MKKIAQSSDTKLIVDKERIAVWTPSGTFIDGDASHTQGGVGTTTTITTTMICFIVNASEAAAN